MVIKDKEKLRKELTMSIGMVYPEVVDDKLIKKFKKGVKNVWKRKRSWKKTKRNDFRY